MTDTYQSPGERLKEERERQKMSERDAANKLHLSMNYLRALEADDYDRLPEPTFVKGYLRNYARLLGLPAAELVAGFEALRTPQQIMQEEPLPMTAPPASRGKAVTAIVGVAVLVLIVGWWLSAHESAEQVDNEVVAENHAPVLPAAPVVNNTTVASAPVAVTGQEMGAQPASMPAGVAPMAPLAPAPTMTNKPALVAQSAQPVRTVAEPTPAAAAAKTSTLLITFSAACWVEVMDASGKELFKGNRAADAQLQLRGAAPFKLMFGNAAGVSAVSVDGKAIALPKEPAGDVAHMQAP